MMFSKDEVDELKALLVKLGAEWGPDNEQGQPLCKGIFRNWLLGIFVDGEIAEIKALLPRYKQEVEDFLIQSFGVEEESEDVN